MAGVDRYYVVEIEGHSASGAGSKLGSSFSICDRAFCHREVATDYTGDTSKGVSTYLRRQRIRAECDRLNALDAA